MVGAVYGVIAMLLGLYMAAIENFKLVAVHAHLALFGFVAMAIYGIAYHIGLAKKDKLAELHFWVSAVGAALFAAGEGVAFYDGTHLIAAAGAALVFLAALQFAYAVYRA